MDKKQIDADADINGDAEADEDAHADADTNADVDAEANSCVMRWLDADRSDGQADAN